MITHVHSTNLCIHIQVSDTYHHVKAYLSAVNTGHGIHQETDVSMKSQ